MFCPTCGQQVDNLIDYSSMRLCPKCGCFVEYNRAEIARKQGKGKLVFSYIFASLSVILCVVYVFFIAASHKYAETYRGRKSIVHITEWEASALSAVTHLLLIAACVAVFIRLTGKNKKAAFALALLPCFRIVYAIIDFSTCQFASNLKVQAYIFIGKDRSMLPIIWNIIILCSFVLMALYILKPKKLFSVSSCVLAIVYFLISGVMCKIPTFNTSDFIYSFIDSAGYMTMVLAVCFSASYYAAIEKNAAKQLV